MAKAQSSKSGMTLEDLYKKAYQEVRSSVWNYRLNSAYLQGNQWNYFAEELDDILPLEESEERVRLVRNRMLTNHRTLMGSLSRQPLFFEVKPDSGDPRALQGSYISTETLYAMAERHGWEDMRRGFVTALHKGGTAGLFLEYDEESNSLINGFLNITEFVLDPGVKQAHQSRWWMRAQVLDPDIEQQRFSLKNKPNGRARPGVNPLADDVVWDDINVSEGHNPQALVLTYYERPNPLCPEGRVAAEVDGRVVFDSTWPFPFEELNLCVGTDVMQDDRWWGIAHYNAARDSQNGLNVSITNLAEHLEDASVARMIAPTSQIERIQAARDTPGEVIPYADGAAPPGYLEPPRLPSWLLELPNLFKDGIDDAMAVHDVRRGMSPPNLESAAALQTLAELDDTPASTTLRTVAEVFSSFGRLSLMMVERYNIKDYAGVVQSAYGDLAALPPKDIGGQVSVHIPEAMLVPRTQAALHQLGMVMLQQGVITSLDQLASFTQSADLRRSSAASNPDIAKARREHLLAGAGEPTIPAVFDDHTVHLAEHNHFRKSATYEMLDDADRSLFDKHCLAHEALAAEGAAKTAGRMSADPTGLLSGAPTSDSSPTAGLGDLPDMADTLPPEPALMPEVPEAEVLPDFSPGEAIDGIEGI